MPTPVAYRDPESVLLADGSVLRIADAIDRLDWQPMLCPTMPHAYTVSTWRSLDRTSFDAVLAMIDHSPDTVLATGAATSGRPATGTARTAFAWTTPGYEPGSIVLNRTDDVDDTRPVDHGGEPIRDWVGCPWEAQGNSPRIYERVESLDGWWPTAGALVAGYPPSKACLRRTPESWSAEERLISGLDK
jgi:hypothetical protein